MTIVTVASAVRRRSPAPDIAAPTSEWQRLSKTAGWRERTTYPRPGVAANASRRLLGARPRLRLLRVAIHDAALHHELHLAHGGDVARRVAIHGDQVREQSALHRADAIFHVQDLRI